MTHNDGTVSGTVGHRGLSLCCRLGKNHFSYWIKSKAHLLITINYFMFISTDALLISRTLNWGKHGALKFPSLFNTPFPNTANMGISHQNWFVFLRVGKSNCWLVLCTFSAPHCRASRHCGLSFTIWKGERIKIQEAYKPPVYPKQTWVSLTQDSLLCAIIKYNDY